MCRPICGLVYGLVYRHVYRHFAAMESQRPEHVHTVGHFIEHSSKYSIKHSIGCCIEHSWLPCRRHRSTCTPIVHILQAQACALLLLLTCKYTHGLADGGPCCISMSCRCAHRCIIYACHCIRVWHAVIQVVIHMDGHTCCHACCQTYRIMLCMALYMFCCTCHCCRCACPQTCFFLRRLRPWRLSHS